MKTLLEIGVNNCATDAVVTPKEENRPAQVEIYVHIERSKHISVILTEKTIENILKAMRNDNKL